MSAVPAELRAAKLWVRIRALLETNAIGAFGLTIEASLEDQICQLIEAAMIRYKKDDRP